GLTPIIFAISRKPISLASRSRRINAPNFSLPLTMTTSLVTCLGSYLQSIRTDRQQSTKQSTAMPNGVLARLVMQGYRRRPAHWTAARQLPLCPVSDRNHAAVQYVVKCHEPT